VKPSSSRPSSLGGGSNFSQADVDILSKKRREGKYEKGSRQLNLGSSQIYHLVSVIVHHGSHLGGHYAVYKRLMTTPFEGSSEYDQFLYNYLKKMDENKLKTVEDADWVYISDDRVQPCNLEEVLQAQAYMLYYEKY